MNINRRENRDTLLTAEGAEFFAEKTEFLIENIHINLRYTSQISPGFFSAFSLVKKIINFPFSLVENIDSVVKIIKTKELLFVTQRHTSQISLCLFSVFSGVNYSASSAVKNKRL